MVMKEQTKQISCTYGPESPGRGKPLIFVLFFFKGKVSAGYEMKVSNFGHVSPFPNGWGI